MSSSATAPSWRSSAASPSKWSRPQFGVSRQTLHSWLVRYARDGLAGLVDRSHRPLGCPHQAGPEVEAAVCELRREHPRWGRLRLRHELVRAGKVDPVPSRMSVHRILVRHGLITPRSRRRQRADYLRWQRQEPMQLWQLDIVGGLMLVDGTEAKVVTGVDDCSRFCVLATVVPRATGRAVCLAFAEALRRYGVPDEVLTDIQWQAVQRPLRQGRRGAVKHQVGPDTDAVLSPDAEIRCTDSPTRKRRAVALE